VVVVCVSVSVCVREREKEREKERECVCVCFCVCDCELRGRCLYFVTPSMRVCGRVCVCVCELSVCVDECVYVCMYVCDGRRMHGGGRWMNKETQETPPDPPQNDPPKRVKTHLPSTPWGAQWRRRAAAALANTIRGSSPVVTTLKGEELLPPLPPLLSGWSIRMAPLRRLAGGKEEPP
jgi:hypothetical protein